MEVNDDATKSDTARAVQSIPAYVESCDMFVALVPDLVHSDTGLQCNYSTWLSRGSHALPCFHCSDAEGYVGVGRWRGEAMKVNHR